jgi:hypothetical protein
MKPAKNTARAWLLENGYSQVAKMIEKVMAEWKVARKKTRRDWWDVLAGHKDGSPCIIEGRKFPVLRAARLRKGWADTSNCMCRNRSEKIPRIVPQGRWRMTEVINER